MPIYEYQCDECCERFEKLVREANKQAEIVCPKCGSPKVHKALSLFGVAGGQKRATSSSASHSCGPT